MFCAFLGRLSWAFGAALAAGAAGGQTPDVRVVFMEPDESAPAGALAAYRVVTDVERIKTYAAWHDNESARLALQLYAQAWKTLAVRESASATLPPYHVALVPGGNHADIGFRLRDEAGWHEYPKWSYIKLAPEDWRFETTFLHETGHVVLHTLAGGRHLPGRELAPIPHTTAMLTDRATAFDEGFAIHLETLAAHLSDDPAMRQRYRHERFDFGNPDLRRSEYARHAADLLSFSQNIARYYEVRENNFAFAPACREPDYLRVQLEKARDFATLRDANQLLQSEGFYASFFFSLTVRGEGRPSPEVVGQRQARMLGVLAEMFASTPPDEDTPYLLRFVETYLRKHPSEGEDVVDVLLDLSHGVFVDPEAATLWRELYLAALRLDLGQLPLLAKVAGARQRWRSEVLNDPKVLYRRLGPQIRCEVPARTVQLVALGEPRPLCFDVNTAPEGVLRMIPHISEAEVSRWLSERARAPFVDGADFRKRCALSDDVLGEVKF